MIIKLLISYYNLIIICFIVFKLIGAGNGTVNRRDSNYETYKKQLTTPYTNADHVLMNTADELFKKLYEHRILIRMIGIRFLIPGNYYIRLFDDTQEMINLYQAIDNVKKRYGEKMVMRVARV